MLEFFKQNDEREGILAVKAYMENKRNFKPSNNGAFAILNIESALTEIAQQISFRDEHLPHCGIYFPIADEMLISRLLAEQVKNNYLIAELN